MEVYKDRDGLYNLRFWNARESEGARVGKPLENRRKSEQRLKNEMNAKNGRRRRWAKNNAADNAKPIQRRIYVQTVLFNSENRLAWLFPEREIHHPNGDSERGENLKNRSWKILRCTVVANSIGRRCYLCDFYLEASHKHDIILYVYTSHTSNKLRKYFDSQ